MGGKHGDHDDRIRGGSRQGVEEVCRLEAFMVVACLKSTFPPLTGSGQLKEAVL